MVADEIKLTMENASRLIDDSIVLNHAGRYKSAVALAIQGIEEFGKGLILSWGVRNKANKKKNPSHIEKQSATFALLAAPEVAEFLRSQGPQSGPNFNEIGPYSHQFAYCRSGFYENLRRCVTYADSDPIYRQEHIDNLPYQLVSELHEYFTQATKLATVEQYMTLAAVIYENNLGRL